MSVWCGLEVPRGRLFEDGEMVVCTCVSAWSGDEVTLYTYVWGGTVTTVVVTSTCLRWLLRGDRVSVGRREGGGYPYRTTVVYGRYVCNDRVSVYLWSWVGVDTGRGRLCVYEVVRR